MTRYARPTPHAVGRYRIVALPYRGGYAIARSSPGRTVYAFAAGDGRPVPMKLWRALETAHRMDADDRRDDPPP